MFENNISIVSPLIHCITNYVTVNDVANILLSSGASPVMADCKSEVEEFATMSGALYLNIGTANESILESMLLSGITANKVGTPVILDPVGVGASTFRNNCISSLLENVKFSVIRGNISEIRSIAKNTHCSRGVDAQECDKVDSTNLQEVITLAKDLSLKTGSIIAISGKTDIIVDSSHVVILKNGDAMMAKITGTGCMLTSLIAAHLASNPNYFDATVSAMAQMGIAGEEAKKLIKEYDGNSTYRNRLIDQISFIGTKELKQKVKYEVL